MPEGPKDVAELSPWRAAIARGRTRYRADALIALPDAEQVVPTLPVLQIYDAVMQIGLADASDLLALCAPEQIRGLLDLDVWERDQIRFERLEPWIAALVELGPDRLGEDLRGLDIELVARYLRAHTRVYDLSLEEPPEDLDRPLFPTPDRFFLVDIPAEEETRKLLERLLDHLYRFDLTLARRLLQTARAEVDANLDEMAYRWRSGRMADLGFVDYYEALEVYRFLDPATVHAGEGTADPAPPEGATVALAGPVADAMAGESFFSRTMATITEPAEIRRLVGALLTLCNRVLAADLVEPSALEAARRALERAHGFLSVGLEVLGRGDPAAAARALTTVALTRTFRVGVSVALKAQRLAETLLSEVPVSVTPGEATLLEAPHADLVAAIRRRPPMTTRDGSETDSAAASDPRPIRSLADVRRVTDAIEEAAAMAQTAVGGLGVDLGRVADLRLGGAAPGRPDEVHLGDLVRTAAVRLLGGGAFEATPLDAGDIEAFLSAAVTGGRLRPDAAAVVTAALAERVRAAGREPPAALGAWVARWVAPLGDDLARLVPPVDCRLVTGVLVAAVPITTTSEGARPHAPRRRTPKPPRPKGPRPTKPHPKRAKPRHPKRVKPRPRAGGRTAVPRPHQKPRPR